MLSKVRLTYPEAVGRAGEPVDLSLSLLHTSFIPVTLTVVSPLAGGKTPQLLWLPVFLRRFLAAASVLRCDV